MHQADVTRENWTVTEACKRLADAGADVVGLNCIRGPATMMPLLRRSEARSAFRWRRCRCLTGPPKANRRSSRCATRTGTATGAAGRSRPRSIRSPAIASRSPTSDATRSRWASATWACAAAPVRITSARWPRRRQASAREQVFGRHVQARVPGLARADQTGPEGLRRQALRRCESARSSKDPWRIEHADGLRRTQASAGCGRGCGPSAVSRVGAVLQPFEATRNGVAVDPGA